MHLYKERDFARMMISLNDSFRMWAWLGYPLVIAFNRPALIERTSLPCNTYATVFLIRLHSALEMA